MSIKQGSPAAGPSQGRTARARSAQPPGRGHEVARDPRAQRARGLPRPGAGAGGRGAQHGGTILGMFIGLVIGVGIAFGVVWYLNKTPLPFQDKTPRAEKQEPAAGQAAKEPQPLPGKPGDKVAEKPRFDFYKILPGEQQATPQGAPATELLFLQAGAFQKPQDADNLKAKLAMLGLEAGVQEVAVPDKGTMHRVRVGPFASPEEMNRVRNQLSQNGVQATLVKVKPQ